MCGITNYAVGMGSGATIYILSFIKIGSAIQKLIGGNARLTDSTEIAQAYFRGKNFGALVRQRTIPTERPPLVGEVNANLADRGCRVVSATNPHGR
jgi:hypothetical protein